MFRICSEFSVMFRRGSLELDDRNTCIQINNKNYMTKKAQELMSQDTFYMYVGK
jgi:hypothetical protein